MTNFQKVLGERERQIGRKRVREERERREKRGRRGWRGKRGRDKIQIGINLKGLLNKAF